MGFLGWIKQVDREIGDAYAGSELYFQLSPTRYSLTRDLFPMVHTYAQGRCLDAGAGRLSYRGVIRAAADVYFAVDVQPWEGLSAAGSVMELPFQDAVFDSLFCSQVLEHVPEPQRALHEFYRCLKPGGCVVISVPHLAYLHNEPHDYFRYTKHGLRVLLEKAGFEIIQIQAAGGLLSFLAHIPSLIFKAVFYKAPWLGNAAVCLNAFCSRGIVAIDRRVDAKKIFALNYIAVAKKPLESHE
jgi:SAM-dependent methyltransferase